MIYTFLPLAVAISTFTTYIALGHNLDVATALTSLALFEILRFPLFMLPMIISNLVESKVSVDRIQSFLLESEKKAVAELPLTETGVKFDNATLVYDSIRKRLQKPTSMISTPLVPVPTQVQQATPQNGEPQSLLTHMKRHLSIMSTFAGQALRILFSKKKAKGCDDTMTDIEFELLVRRAQVEAMGKRIAEIEGAEETKADPQREEDEEEEAKTGERILTLFRVSLEARGGSLFCIVGKVGSGKVFCSANVF
jgi:ABC-type multidrug transport system fused ATPase/permease subunit